MTRWRLPIALQFYAWSLLAFVLVSWAIVAVHDRAEAWWWQAGDTRVGSEQQPIAMLLAMADEAPIDRDRLTTWYAGIVPQQGFALYDADGHRLFAHGLLAEATPERPDLPARDWSGGDLAAGPIPGLEYVRVPGTDGRDRYAIVRYEPNAEQDRIADLGWWAALAVMLLAYLAVAAWFELRVAAPLRRLRDVTDALAAGRIDARTGSRRADELGDLARAFDSMAGQIGDLLAAQQVLMAQVAHELRTPLARLGVALDLADDGDADALSRLGQGMRADLRELDVLVADLLAGARLEVARARGEGLGARAAPLDVGSFLADVAARFVARHPDRELTVSAPDAPVQVVGDRVLLHRAIGNLLENAARYAPGPIVLAAGATPDGVRITVADRGPGLDEAERERVFLPFVQVGAGEATSAGFGLGLSLCRRVVDAHGGSVRLEAREGGGLVAVVELVGGEGCDRGR